MGERTCRWAETPEVAAITGHSEGYLRKLCRSGEIVARQLRSRGTWRILVDALGWPVEAEDVAAPTDGAAA